MQIHTESTMWSPLFPSHFLKCEVLLQKKHNTNITESFALFPIPMKFLPSIACIELTQAKNSHQFYGGQGRGGGEGSFENLFIW